MGNFKGFNVKQRFSIRKYASGAASVLLGLTLVSPLISNNVEATPLGPGGQLSASYTGFHTENNGAAPGKVLGALFDDESSMVFNEDAATVNRAGGKATVINLWSGVPLGRELQFTIGADATTTRITGNRQAKTATGNLHYGADNAEARDFQNVRIEPVSGKTYKLVDIVSTRNGAQVNYIQTKAPINGGEALSFRAIMLSTYAPLEDQSIINKTYGEQVTKEEILNAVTVHSGKVYNQNDARPKQVKVNEALSDVIDMEIPEGTVLPDWGMGNKVPVKLTFKNLLATTDEGKSITMYVTVNFTGSPAERPKQSDNITPTTPTKTPVADTSALTDAEKQTVADAVKAANKDKFPEGTAVEVGANGTATITYPDGSTDTIPGTELVEAKAKDADSSNPVAKELAVVPGTEPKAEDSIANASELPAGTTYAFKEPVDTTTPGERQAVVVVTYPDGSSEEVTVTIKVATPNESDAQKYPVVVPSVTPVENVKSLTREEAAIIVQKLKDANPNAINVIVGADGTTTIVYADGSQNVISGNKLVTLAKATVAVPNKPKKTSVANVNNLTEAERRAVAESVRLANPNFPAGTKIFVDSKGNVTVTFPNGEISKINANQTVTGKKALPKTGDNTANTIALGLISLATGLFIVAKRRENEE